MNPSQALQAHARPVGKPTLIAAGALVMLAVLPLFVFPVSLMKLLCYALFAASFNLLFGYVGLLSFGHAAFFGGAAYVTANVMKRFAFTPELGILAGVLFAALLGAVFGALAVRRKGIYFAMVTLALAQLFYFVCLRLPYTGGEDGIQGIPRGRLFGLVDLSNSLTMYYFVLAVFVLGCLAMWRIVHSPFGSILAAIKEDENRAISLGLSVQRYKFTAFVLSAALAGLAGSTKALVFEFATLADVNWHASGDAIMMTLLGGIGTFAGPLAGAWVFVTLQNAVAYLAVPGSIVTGLTFIFCILVLRRGVVGEVARLVAARRTGKRA